MLAKDQHPRSIHANTFDELLPDEDTLVLELEVTDGELVRQRHDKVKGSE